MSLAQELKKMSGEQLQRIHNADKYTIFDIDSPYDNTSKLGKKMKQNGLTTMQKSLINYLHSVRYATAGQVNKNTEVKSKSVWGMLNTLVDAGRVFKRQVKVKGRKNPLMYYSTTRSNLNELQDEI